MKIILDKNAGFCFGVKNAVNEVFKLIDDDVKNIYTYGSLIHNNQVIERLQSHDVKCIEDLDDIDVFRNHTLIIRSHGISENELQYIKNKGVKYINCTCPYVSNIHKIVSTHYINGYNIFIIGDANHPEVKGINGWCNFTATILNDEKTVDKLPIYDKICLVAQTTITKDLWDRVLSAVKKKYKEVEVFNTICNATQQRQKSVEELSRQVDALIVIGSHKSSNTNKLFEISKKNCNDTFHIETADELPLEILKCKQKIGITAGASTPDWIIKEVITVMNELQNQLDTNMMEEYEKSFKNLSVDDNVIGTVISVSNDEVMVDIGYKADGIIQKDEFTWDRDANLKELIKPHDEVEVKILKMNDGEGNVVLSKKQVDAEKNWYKIEYAVNEKTPVEGYITDLVKGGGIIEIYGIKAFIPASLFDIKYNEDLTQFLNKRVTVMIMEFDKDKKRVIASRKEYLKQENQRKEKELWTTIAEGQKIIGEVKRLTDFGAFVDIGGIDGLIHISELSWSRVKHPSEVVKPGQKVEVIILSLNKEKKKISLGLKQLLPEPWANIESKYHLGDIVNVKVLRFSTFGAFVELEPGVDGLVHISQISENRIAKPSDILKLNEYVKAKIMDIKLEEKKISLSIKEANV